MSGHSKWANIKRQKAVVDAKKGAVYARMAREIIVAARSGGGDPNANFRLRTAIDRAKAEGVPNDNIQRAIEKGSGGGAGDNLEELTYEGYGPGGVAVLLKCMTDNRNRTAGDIRSTFSKYGGNLGETGCVGWMFKERGEVLVESLAAGKSEDDLLLEVSDAGADDMESNGDSTLVVCKPELLEQLKNAIAAGGYTVGTAEITMSPLNTVEITDKDVAKQLLKLLDVLENHDDVQNVYANFDMNADWMQEFMS